MPTCLTPIRSTVCLARYQLPEVFVDPCKLAVTEPPGPFTMSLLWQSMVSYQCAVTLPAAFLSFWEKKDPYSNTGLFMIKGAILR